MLDMAQEGKQAVSKYKSRADQVIPPQLLPAFERVVVAGHKLLYSKEMKELIDKQLAMDTPIEQKMAEGATALILILAQRSKPQMPPELLVPGAIEMLFEGIDYLTQAGMIEPLNEEQTKFAVQITIALVLQKLGVAKEQIMQALTKGAA